MSFQRITISGSIRSSRKSAAIASWTMRSPSSSSRFSSTSAPGRRGAPSAASARSRAARPPDEDPALLDGVPRRRLDPVELEQVADLLDVVDDVVELGRELVDVLAVERRHVLRVQERISSRVISSPAVSIDFTSAWVTEEFGVLAEARLGLPGRLERVRRRRGRRGRRTRSDGGRGSGARGRCLPDVHTAVRSHAFTASSPPRGLDSVDGDSRDGRARGEAAGGGGVPAARARRRGDRASAVRLDLPRHAPTTDSRVAASRCGTGSRTGRGSGS